MPSIQETTKYQECLREMAQWYCDHRREATTEELGPVIAKYFSQAKEIDELLNYLNSAEGKEQFLKLLRLEKLKRGIAGQEREDIQPMAMAMGVRVMSPVMRSNTLLKDIIPRTKGVRMPKADRWFIVPWQEADEYVKDSAVKQTLFHGSAFVDNIIREGFRLEAPRRYDPGDFGWGIYFSDDIGRAYSSGGIDIRPGYEKVLAVKVNVKNPLFLRSPYSIGTPITDGDRFIWRLREQYGDTVHGLTQDEAVRLYEQGKPSDEIHRIQYENRVRSSKKWAQEIQAAGYDCVVWERGERWPMGPIEHEVVIYDPNRIRIIGRY